MIHTDVITGHQNPHDITALPLIWDDMESDEILLRIAWLCWHVVCGGYTRSLSV